MTDLKSPSFSILLGETSINQSLQEFIKNRKKIVFTKNEKFSRQLGRLDSLCLTLAVQV
jgi:hypothetical protein